MSDPFRCALIRVGFLLVGFALGFVICWLRSKERYRSSKFVTRLLLGVLVGYLLWVFGSTWYQSL